MEARLLRMALLTTALTLLGASYRTQNFVVTAPTAEQAEQIGKAAESFRRDLAIEWLGHAMPNWAQPCPINAQVGDQLGAGGATSFVFEHGEVFGWRMTIQGSQVRILDSVLPHEVTHTIFATHFRRPLPRWADEGACTTVEHVSERAKQQNMLIDFLRNGRGIAFSKMFAMKEYPHDVMPLYSQGYSLARYLIAQRGKHVFLEFVADGLRDENWPRATQQHYGVGSLASLQDQWLDWVRKGSPALGPSPSHTPPGDQSLVAVKMPGPTSSAPQPEPEEPQWTNRSSGASKGSNAVASTAGGTGDRPSVYELASQGKGLVAPEASQSMADLRGAEAEQAHTQLPNSPATSSGDWGVVPNSTMSSAMPSPIPYQVTRPQGYQRPRQVILEWNRPQPQPEATSALSQGRGGTVTR